MQACIPIVGSMLFFIDTGWPESLVLVIKCLPSINEACSKFDLQDPYSLPNKKDSGPVSPEFLRLVLNGLRPTKFLRNRRNEEVTQL